MVQAIGLYHEGSEHEEFTGTLEREGMLMPLAAAIKIKDSLIEGKSCWPKVALVMSGGNLSRDSILTAFSTMICPSLPLPCWRTVAIKEL